MNAPRRLPSIPLLFLLISVLTAPVRSTSFVERVWLLDEGLPHNVVHKVAQDSRGFLWVSTSHGIARFDGHDFKNYSPTFAGDFRQFLRDMAFASDGSLVILPAAGGVFTLKDRTILSHPLNDVVKRQQLFAVHTELDGAIWVAGETQLIRWSKNGIQTFGSEQGFHRKSGARYSFATDRTGTLWISTGADIFKYSKGVFFPPQTIGASTLAVAPARTGDVWIITKDRLLRGNSDQTSQLVSSDPAWEKVGEVMHAMEDRSGALWVASRNHGLFRFADGRLESIPVSHPRLSMIMQDDEENIWVASNGGGLLRLRPKVFAEPPPAHGIEMETTSSITTDDNTLWLANRDNGLAAWKDNLLRAVTPLPSSHNKFYLVCADRQGRVWATTENGLYRFPADNPDAIERVSQITWPVYALHCARNGDMWVCSDQKRIGFFRNDHYHPVSNASEMPGSRIGAFSESDSGDFWLSTQDGVLLKYAEGRFIRDANYDRLFAHRIHALHFDHDGSLWIGSRIGLIRKRGDDYRLIAAAQGLPDDLIIQILEDESRRLWIGSRRGIYSVSLDELNAVADGKFPRVGASTLGRNEGLVGAYSFVGGPPTSVKDRNGILWFATHRGVIGIDPSVQSPSRMPPRIHIDEILVHGNSMEITTTDAVRFNTSDSPIEFRFAAVCFSAPEKVRIRHRLEGLETEWTETSEQRSATYARLPPGTYQLRVFAGNQEGAWTETPATLTIIVDPSWWQTWWFRTATILLFSGTLILGVRHWSHRRLRARIERLEREHALEKERARIARDLHDELGGSLTQINLLAERVKRQAGHSEIEKPLSDLAARTRSIAGELESIVWTVSPKNATWSALASFIGSFASRFFRDADIAFTVENVGAIPDLALLPDVQHHVLAVAKEAINNVCKHARATRATLLIGIENDAFFFSLKDDGVGFHPTAPELNERNGLTNMRARAREIGATLSIESAPGSGTTLTLRVQLRVPPKTHSFSN